MLVGEMLLDEFESTEKLVAFLATKFALVFVLDPSLTNFVKGPDKSNGGNENRRRKSQSSECKLTLRNCLHQVQ